MLILFALTAAELEARDSRIEELIAKISSGDASAIGALYEIIETDVYAYALSKTTNKEDAEDITHDTFVQIYKYAPQYRPMGKPMAWIITIALNLCRKRFQSRQRTVSFDDAIEVPDGEDFAERIIDNEFLRELMRILTEEEREIITLHIVSGFKHREIAKLLEKPLSTVLSKYNRALKKLQLQVMEKEEK